MDIGLAAHDDRMDADGALQRAEEMLREASALAERARSVMPQARGAAGGTARASAEGAADLAEQVRQMRLEAKQLVRETEAVQLAQDLPAAVAGTDSSRQQAHTLALTERRLQQELQRLQREITAQIETPVNLETNERLDYAIAKEQVARTTREVREALPFLRDQIAEAREDLERAIEIRDSLQQLNAEIVRRRDAGGAGSQPPSQRIVERTRAIKTETNDFMVSLVQFIEKFYPSHTIDGPSGPRDASIKSLLEDLMNQAIVRPEDPFVALGDDHWLPYVELLIRSGIALKDPQDGTRLRLVDFHA